MLKDTISYFDSKEKFYHGFITAVMTSMADYSANPIVNLEMDVETSLSDLFPLGNLLLLSK